MSTHRFNTGTYHKYDPRIAEYQRYMDSVFIEFICLTGRTIEITGELTDLLMNLCDEDVPIVVAARRMMHEIYKDR